jgi:alpha-L-glutamate ligase-like protein
LKLLKKLIGTIITIFIVYFVLTYEILISFIALNPETWILLIGANFYLALKSDLRLFDNLRFNNLFKKLKNKKDVLSLNERNREYISKYNPINLFSSLNKDDMKISFHQLGIPTPKTYMFIECEEDLENLYNSIYDKKSFVIKPTKGLGGEGILVIDKKEGSFYIKDKEITFDEIKNHIKQILEGQYSNDSEDKAIIEEKIIVAKEYSKYFYPGVFDIRVIVFCGFPVMAMMRIPTKESKGLANIHKDAITVGVDIGSGKCVNPQWKSHGGSLKYHPDTNFDLTKIHISNWNEILKISCLAQGASKLNYAGVDVAVSNNGPLILEVNKRPGLEIQNANMQGLLKRLKFIEDKLSSIRFLDIKDRIELVKKYNKEKWE